MFTERNPATITVGVARDMAAEEIEYETILAFTRFEKLTLTLGIDLESRSLGYDVVAEMDNGEILIFPDMWGDAVDDEGKALLGITGIEDLRIGWSLSKSGFSYNARISLLEGGGWFLNVGDTWGLTAQLKLHDGRMCLDAGLDLDPPLLAQRVYWLHELIEVGEQLGGNPNPETFDATHGICVASSYQGAWDLGGFKLSLDYGVDDAIPGR